jgi:long-chain acyl-CoA synthetase
MTQVTRLFDFPYYQQDKYTSIPDAKYKEKKVVFG